MMTESRFSRIPDVPTIADMKAEPNLDLLPQALERVPAVASVAGTLRRTPGLLLGPYYPLNAPSGPQPNLWPGTRTPGSARRLILRGQVLNAIGEAIEGAQVELWHADPSGHYPHPSAPFSDVVDPAFTGYGSVHTDPAGGFAFSSIEPGSYVEADVLRAPHLHVQVTGRVDRLVTQLFLPGQRANVTDRWYRSLQHAELLTPKVEREDSETLQLHWNAVLRRG